MVRDDDYLYRDGRDGRDDGIRDDLLYRLRDDRIDGIDGIRRRDLGIDDLLYRYDYLGYGGRIYILGLDDCSFAM
ncbi:unnamed protein product [Rotaria sordida]|uniref:Uncharacterized protein n=1 Tax=Rotaria sordida TaxID=392033 RepID=A0A815AGV4_9BILA|nr:unnamed protein product [Rotaria sordida]CAF4197165.1 unnamed protein product [Rotaria sordida]